VGMCPAEHKGLDMASLFSLPFLATPFRVYFSKIHQESQQAQLAPTHAPLNNYVPRHNNHARITPLHQKILIFELFSKQAPTV
jgi:hypothetical protein